MDALGIGTVGAVVASGFFAVVSGTQLASEKLFYAIKGEATVKALVAPGETVDVTWKYLKLTDCPGKASRVWSGGQGFLLIEPERTTTLKPGGGWQTAVVKTRIPIYAPPGEVSFSRRGCGGWPNMGWLSRPNNACTRTSTEGPPSSS